MQSSSESTNLGKGSAITNRKRTISALLLVAAGMLIPAYMSPSFAKDQYGFPTAQELRDNVAACRKKYGDKSPQTAKALEQLSQCRTLWNTDECLQSLLEALPIRKQEFNFTKFKTQVLKDQVELERISSHSIDQVIDPIGHTREGEEYVLDLNEVGRILLARRVAKRNGPMQARTGQGVKLQIGLTDVNAEAIWKELVDIAERSLGSEHEETERYRLYLANVENNAENYKDAAALCKKVIAIEEQKNLPKQRFSNLFWALGTLRATYEDMSNDKDAEEIFKKEIAYLKACDPEGPFMACVLEDYSELLRRQARPNEALPLEQHAVLIRQKTHTYREHSGKAVLLKKAH